MQVREKRAGADPVSMDWHQAQTALQTGNFELVGEGSGERGPDQPAAQSPSPGTPPKNGLPSGDELERMTRAELDTLAAERGVDVSQAKNKGDVIDALQSKQA